MSKKTRESYGRDFKINAVRMITEQGRSGAEVARELGVSPNTLYLWKRQFTKDPEETFPGKDNQASKEDYIRRLELENKRLKDECDILKEATAFFGKNPE